MVGVVRVSRREIRGRGSKSRSPALQVGGLVFYSRVRGCWLVFSVVWGFVEISKILITAEVNLYNLEITDLDEILEMIF